MAVRKERAVFGGGGTFVCVCLGGGLTSPPEAQGGGLTCVA